jgi:hypothetical protein
MMMVLLLPAKHLQGVFSDGLAFHDSLAWDMISIFFLFFDNNS